MIKINKLIKFHKMIKFNKKKKFYKITNQMIKLKFKNKKQFKII